MEGHHAAVAGEEQSVRRAMTGSRLEEHQHGAARDRRQAGRAKSSFLCRRTEPVSRLVSQGKLKHVGRARRRSRPRHRREAGAAGWGCGSRHALL